MANEIDSLNRENLDVDGLSPEDLEQVSGGNCEIFSGPCSTFSGSCTQFGPKPVAENER